jgi:hypothetical protein
MPPFKMNKQLVLCALLIGYSLQAAAHAQTWWLLIGGRNGSRPDGTSSITLIPTNSYEECNKGGDRILNSKDEPSDLHGKIFTHIRYVCVQGK